MRKRLKQKDAELDSKPPRYMTHFYGNETGEEIPRATMAQISVWMADIGRKGGKVGGKRRLETMTPRERSSAARKAARARWKKSKRRR